MAITEQSRDQMHQRLKEVLGEQQATTLMEHLPPVGWADVATKRDLDDLRAATKGDIDHLREVMDLRFEATEHRLRTELHKTLRVHMLAIIGAMAAFNGSLVALVR